MASDDDIKEFLLSGPKLEKDSNDLDLIDHIGHELYKKNRDFIKEKIQENWYGVIEPTTGYFIASESPNRLFEYTREKYKNKLFYVVGLLKNNLLQHV